MKKKKGEHQDSLALGQAYQFIGYKRNATFNLRHKGCAQFMKFLQFILNK